jgi:hypothetical protein
VRRRVAEVRAEPGADLAVLVLAEPAPPQARPAPLRCPEAADLADERWWAFGFPAGAPYGSDAHGIVGVELAHGRALLASAGFDGTVRLWDPVDPSRFCRQSPQRYDGLPGGTGNGQGTAEVHRRL